MTAALEKFSEEQTDAHNFRNAQAACDLAQWKMSGDERNGQVAACKKHGVILDLATRGKEFRLSPEFKTNFVHARFMNRSGDDRVDLSP